MKTKPTFEAGLHEQVPAETYHAAEGVSNSDLKLFSESPRTYFNAKVLGLPETDSDSDEEKDALVNGTLLHLAVLEPEKFGAGKSHYIQPDTYKDAKTGEVKKWNGNSNVCKEWLETHKDKPVRSQKEHNRIVNAAEAVMAHPVAGPLLKARGVNEVSVFARHPRTGLMLRMRADRLTEDGDGRPWCVDLKTCPNVRQFVRTARDFRYDVQDAFYTDALDLVGVGNVMFCFVAVELKPRYGIHAVRVVSMDPETRDAARAIYEADLDRFAVCERNDDWPLEGMEIEWVRVRRWT